MIHYFTLDIFMLDFELELFKVVFCIFVCLFLKRIQSLMHFIFWLLKIQSLKDIFGLKMCIFKEV